MYDLAPVEPFFDLQNRSQYNEVDWLSKYEYTFPFDFEINSILTILLSERH